MSKEISPLNLKQIKTAAKRLGKFLPNKSHTERLDIASYQLFGLLSYTDAIKAGENILKVRSEPDHTNLNGMKRNITYGQKINQLPAFRSGDWYFYPNNKEIIFDGEFIPYVISLNQLSNSVKLLDFILQLQKKKWPKDLVKKSGISPTYQVDEFIDLVNQLCTYYFNMPIQEVFSPFGDSKQVAWPQDMISKALEEARQYV